MSPARVTQSTTRALYLKYLTLPFPWRTKRLAGYDLDGNLFFEWKDPNHNPHTGLLMTISRTRRMVEYANPAENWSDHKLSPLWISWLRHRRHDAPGWREMMEEDERVRTAEERARLADQRWQEAKLEQTAAKKMKEIPMQDPKKWEAKAASIAQESGGVGAQDTTEAKDAKERPKPEESAIPAMNRTAKDWQPDAWVPKPGARRG
ncbi:hypothetical protein SAICODRAFT_29119 [Saitoella complicata NRRL Y-17804]|uniref:NADH dehydrogenase [ubiquinone] 1 alpha subcomplex subunit n=1 Tax=Saitoella complicata (strain BCRC 22490 / CBS 7301 / JCM 7358 / NBRC 10748 / NRRL Y-17804) TaxID=698492 RepID=A0A0E9NIT4_SAICN|nr:uncharacterized protein SAICODRAFT_29119 [Saitoella complicata NRRL Y-17804]ODQ54885.1 hypothetical protein SAICODRAFT_29119 [Saitoella complicata NRRL Y-17804]GAO49782.1 hypothetical protein G7K_3924-t1 [Saitoella complicata NRRL Y-17804]